MQKYKIANVSETLVYHRLHAGSASSKLSELQNKYKLQIIRKQIRAYTGIDFPERLVNGFLRPNLICEKKDAVIISKIIFKLYHNALKWDLSKEEKSSIKSSAAYKLRTVWKS